MAGIFDNPYLIDEQNHEFWEMCVRRDLEAFLKADWNITSTDFDADDFIGIDAAGSSNPEDWLLKYPTLQSYRLEFDKQAQEFAGLKFSVDPREAMYGALTLSDPQVEGDRATILKTFNGVLSLVDGSKQILSWKSLFYLKYTTRWRFTGFVGYLPIE